jgi:hypothetical protein
MTINILIALQSVMSKKKQKKKNNINIEVTKMSEGKKHGIN